MPNYLYTAKTIDGETKTGIMQAKDEHQLAQDLKNQGSVLIKAVAGGKKKALDMNIKLPFSGVSATEKIMMVKNLGVMFATGLSLVKSFDILASQAKNKKLKDALQDIRDKINKGENLSDSLSGYPQIFSELFCNMIKIGEESGTLEEIFQELSLQLQKEHELKSKIKNAMIYPSIIIMVMVVVGIIMVTVVLPSLNIFFTSLNVEIPIYTKIMLIVGAFLSVHWYLLIVAPLAIVGGVYATMKTARGKRAIDGLLLKVPAISPIVKKNNAAFLVRSLSSMISAGVSLVRALEISSKTVGNTFFKEAVVEAGKKIKKGEKLSFALKPYENIFPIGVIEMMEVGEETGKTSVILKKLADFYEQEAIDAIEKLSILIEPILIIFLGVAAGVFAFSIIEPMYSSLQFITT